MRFSIVGGSFYYSINPTIWSSCHPQLVTNAYSDPAQELSEAASTTSMHRIDECHMESSPLPDISVSASSIALFKGADKMRQPFSCVLASRKP